MDKVMRNNYDIKDIGRLILKENCFYTDDLLIEGYSVSEKNVFYVESDDPKLYISDIQGGKITNALVRLNKPAETTLNVVLYYSESGEAFSENKTVVGQIEAGKKETELSLRKGIVNLRIDIGMYKGEQFEFKDIRLNHFCWFQKDFFFYWFILCFLFLLVAFSHNLLDGKLYRNRYGIALGFSVIAILFKLHGASLNYWAVLYGNDAYSLIPQNIFGVSRGIRGDDWAVFTSMALSQKYNGYRYFSNLIGINPMDVFIVYGQPVRDMAALLRPSHLGYSLLGSEYGLSFFWIMRSVILFMVSWDFGMMITDKKKNLSLVYATGILFSPLIQWWFGTNGLVEILIFGQLAVMLIKKYTETDDVRKKIGYCLSTCYCGCVYVLVFYPAWQISFAYVFLAMVIWIFWENEWKRLKTVFGKKDLVIWGSGMLLSAAALGYVVYKSHDAISATMNTVYPGKRFATGGGSPTRWLSTWNGIFLLHSQTVPIGTNECEMAGFLDFVPFGFVLAIMILAYAVYQKKEKDKLLIVLLILTAIGMVWSSVGLPDFLCKLTLLFPVTTDRGVNAISLAQWILLIRCLSLKERPVIRWWQATIFSALAAGLVFYANSSDYSAYYKENRGALLIVSVICAGIVILLWSKEKSDVWNSIILIVFFIFSSLLVNPVVSGLDAIDDNLVLQRVKELSEQDDVWMFEGGHHYMGNSLLASGVKTLNCIHVYPDLEMWHTVDPDGKYENVYNRYQLIKTKIVSEDTYFEIGTADSINVYLTPEDVKKLGVTKIVTTDIPENLATKETGFCLLDQIGIYKIYQVE